MFEPIIKALKSFEDAVVALARAGAKQKSC